MPGRLAIIAGEGPLPRRLAETAIAAGRDVFILSIDGITDQATTAGLPSDRIGLGQIGKAIAILHREKIAEICMLGPLKRPALSQIGLDGRGLSLLPKLWRRGTGDDSLLRIVVEEFEAEGFRVVGAHEVERGLLAPEGLLGKVRPDEAAMRDIQLGVKVATRLGELDVGQSVVVQDGMVLGVEAIEGTDALLARCAQLRRDVAGGVLVKLMKPQQDRRADLPTIGPRTVEGAVTAKLAGIAIDAGNTLLVERERTIAACDAAGLFLLGLVPPR